MATRKCLEAVLDKALRKTMAGLLPEDVPARVRKQVRLGLEDGLRRVPGHIKCRRCGGNAYLQMVAKNGVRVYRCRRCKRHIENRTSLGGTA